MIGRHLSKILLRKGYKVTLLSRSKSGSESLPVAYWDPQNNIIDNKALSESDVIINLAGTNIGSAVWTAARKRSIFESRINTGRLLFNAVSKNTRKPELFISASGVSYYGVITSENIFSETDPPGTDFLADTCKKWEETSGSFGSLGVRTVIFRNGLVLTREGGVIKRLYLPFNIGLGAVLGKGNQYIPWIHIDDLCRIYCSAIENQQLSGIYNSVAPDHIDFSDFAHHFAAALHRKIFLPRVPSVLLKLFLGEMSQIVLKGSRVSSEKISGTGYQFLYPDLKSALNQILKNQE